MSDANRYQGKDFIPRLPLERCRPLEERLSVRLDAAPAALAKAARQAVAGEQVAREIESARAAGLGRAKKIRAKALAKARAAGRTGPAQEHPWRKTP